MSLDAIKPISIDFHDSKYISVNAKQYDRNSRFVLATCYNNRVLFPLNNAIHYAYVRYRKADNLGVFNSCEITDDGNILIELTEQMLSEVGKCYADLVIVENKPIEIAENTGELVVDDNDSILSSMTICINVIEAAFDNTEIESSYEYNALNELMLKATEDYAYIMKACRISEDNAKSSADQAKISATNANTAEKNAKTAEKNAQTYATDARSSANKASTSEANAKTSERNADVSEDNARIYAQNAQSDAAIASEKADIASTAASAAATSADLSAEHSALSQSYAVGGTGVRTNEDTDNAKYYFTQTKNINDSLGGSFLPRGTIKFEELATVAKEAGYVYHIENDFVTTNEFKGGAGKSYRAGTNVYRTVDGYWDCFVNETLVVKDDGDGNVEVLCSYDFVATYEKSYEQVITELERRIAAIEGQTVLEISE